MASAGFNSSTFSTNAPRGRFQPSSASGRCRVNEAWAGDGMVAAGAPPVRL